MAKILAFRGITYNTKQVNPSLVLTQPYDKINDELQRKYYKRHPYNLVRITKGKEKKGDNNQNNKYTRARQFLNKWLDEQILVQDKEPAIYAYYQEYRVDNQLKVRKGFIALARLEDFGKGGVHAHERTLLKPKQDRLSMMRAVGGSTGQVFMLYADPQLLVNKLLDQTIKGKKPDLQAKDDYGEIHKLWKVTAPAVINKIAQLFTNKALFIADGHHRYETAINYRNEMRGQGLTCAGNESYENRMMTFVNMDDAGLTILPTHRLIFGLPKFWPYDLLKALAPYFDITEYLFSTTAEEKQARKQFLTDLKNQGKKHHAFGLVTHLPKYCLLTLKDESLMDTVIKEKQSPAWKRLDVTILHSLILDKLLGISKEKVAREENVEYRRHTDEVFEALKKKRYQMGFLLNPTKAHEVKDIAAKGERMPQKSTDFYPKLLSGIVISKIAYI